MCSLRDKKKQTKKPTKKTNRKKTQLETKNPTKLKETTTTKIFRLQYLFSSCFARRILLVN